jgi:hypothetical protein
MPCFSVLLIKSGTQLEDSGVRRLEDALGVPIDPRSLPWEGPIGPLAPNSRYQAAARLSKVEEQSQRLTAEVAERRARLSRLPPVGHSFHKHSSVKLSVFSICCILLDEVPRTSIFKNS